VKLTANHFLAALEPDSASIVNNYTGQSRQIEQVALAVMATPQTVNDRLYQQLHGKVKELYRVGDCVAPRRVEHAILDGERAARVLSRQAQKSIV
jgi:glutamate racemase